MGNIHVVKETTLTVEKKPLVLALPYLVSISIETKTKLKQSLKSILNCRKLQILFNNKTRLDNNFHFKNRIPKDLIWEYDFPKILSQRSAMSTIMVNV